MSNINFLPPSNFNENLHVFSIITLNIISFNQNKIVSLIHWKKNRKKKYLLSLKKRERFITVLYWFFNRGRKKKRFKKEKQHT